MNRIIRKKRKRGEGEGTIVIGRSEVETALRKLSLRRANELNEQDYQEEEEERRRGRHNSHRYMVTLFKGRKQIPNY